MYVASLTSDCNEDLVVREIVAQDGTSALSVVVELHNDLETSRYGRLVRKLKGLSDTMIVGKLPLTASQPQVEKAFSSGFHALIFAANDRFPEQIATPATQLAAQMFPSGAVFLSWEGDLDAEQIKQVAAARLVPLCDAPWKIVKPLLTKAGLDGKWLYFLGFYDNAQTLGMKDKILKKVLLESANLKHSLRVSQVEESYQSSSL